ncbi:MAG TPA: hypothetical protein VFD58_25530 [Blastocatellia bacterium]|nr:hypothetical protein [Blastocatellia bacterium]
MLPELSLLVRLVRMVDDAPTPPPPRRPRGAPVAYPETIFLKGLLVMLLRQITTPHALLAFPDQDDPAIVQLRDELQDGGIMPSRRTWERRIRKLPARLPELIGSLGRELVRELEPWLSAAGQEDGHAASIDSTPLKTGGGIWHKNDRQNGVIPD